MKKLIDSLRTLANIGGFYHKEICGHAIAALEAAEAENAALRLGMKGDYDLDAWLEWAKEKAGLRARVAELELKLKPPSRDPNSCISCGAIEGHGGLQCPSYLLSMECGV